MIEIPTYNNVEQFYRLRGGKFSGEADYGVWWRKGVIEYPTWRISYVFETGDVYAVENADQKRVLLLGTVPPDSDQESYAKSGRRDLRPYKTLDRLLGADDHDNGWTAYCGRLNGVEWVLAQLREYPPTERSTDGSSDSASFAG